MIRPLLGEAEAVIPGEGEDGADIRLHLKLGNPEWVLAERQLGGTSYLDIVSSLIAAEMSGRSASLDTTRAVLWAATRRDHPELTLDECGEIVAQFGVFVLGSLGEAIRGSIKMKDAEPGEAKPAKGPAKPGTGTKP
jgi:hypothetical protein